MLDQAIHFCAALVLVTLAADGTPLSMALAGFFAGFIRELTEEGRPISPASIGKALQSFPDLFFWALGGAAAYYIQGVIQ